MRWPVLSVGVMAAAVAASLATVVSCDERFEPPCRMTERTASSAASLLGLRISPITLFEGADEEVVAAWLSVVPNRGDAGAADAGADADADAPPQFFAPDVSVAVIGPSGVPRLARTFAPPKALAARRGSTQLMGATFTGDGVLFHWQEVSITTAPDGTTTSSAALRLQRVGLDGNEGPLSSDPDLACVRCALDASFAIVGTTTAAIVTEARPGSSAPARARLLAFASDGTRLATADLEPLVVAGGGAETAAAGALGGARVAQGRRLAARLTAQHGLFVARIERAAAIFDPSLVLRGGPYVLPTTEAELDVELPSRTTALVWNESARYEAEDAAIPPPVGGLPDLLFQATDPSGARSTSARRISASFTALEVRRNDGRTGVLHNASALYFSLVDESGKKTGGDLLVSPPITSSAVGSVGGTNALDVQGARTVMTAPDRTHFVIWSAGDAVVRQVVSCDP